MANNTGANLDIIITADGVEIRGGDTARLLKWLGSDITITGSGAETYLFPAAGDTLVGRVSTDTMAHKTLTSPVVNTSLTGTAVLDEDDFASDSATKVATQQSIKAYIAAQLAAYSTTFLGLTDTPNAYAGQGGKFVKVNITPDGLEFGTIGAADLPSGIDAEKIANGTVTNTEFQYLANVTSDVQSQLGAKEVSANKGQLNGYASLDAGGKVPSAQLPAIAMVDVFVVASEVAQLALTVEEGDVCVRTDLSRSYIALNDDNITMADWQELLTPTDAVLSVNGLTGAVTLDPDDLDDTSTTHKFTTSGDISKLSGIESGAEVNTVDSVNGQTGAVSLDPDDLDDAATTHKFISATELSKLAGIEAGAEVNVVDSVNGQTGTVSLDPDDLDDAATTHKFISATELSKLAGIEDNANNYSLPIAAAAVLGGIKIGDRLTIDINGVLSADVQGGGASAFTDLTDVPASYAVGDALKYVRVNAAHNGLEFETFPSIPTQYTDEMAQDAVGGVVGVGLSYDDITGAISLSFLGLQSLSDPGANVLMGWDDTDNLLKFIALGAGLSYDHASHTLSSTGGYTDENAQDAVGNIMVAGEAIDIVYDDGVPSITISCEDATDANKGVVELATLAEVLAGTDTGRAITPASLLGILLPPQGWMLNGKIVPSIGGFNSLVVAIKTLAGGDPSATDPVYVRIGDTIRMITAATSVSVANGTGANYFNGRSTELMNYWIDYFVYLIWNTTPATDIVDIGIARVPYARVVGDLSATTTNERYFATGNGSAPGATDQCEVVGRITAKLGNGPGYSWSLSGTGNVINRPIYQSDWHIWNAQYTCAAPMGITGITNYVVDYMVDYNKCVFDQFAVATLTGTSSNLIYVTLPFISNNSNSAACYGFLKYNGGTSEIGATEYFFSNQVYIRNYNGSVHTLGSGTEIGSSGVYALTTPY